jgi:hypothetical protein
MLYELIMLEELYDNNYVNKKEIEPNDIQKIIDLRLNEKDVYSSFFLEIVKKMLRVNSNERFNFFQIRDSLKNLKK